MMSSVDALRRATIPLLPRHVRPSSSMPRRIFVRFNGLCGVARVAWQMVPDQIPVNELLEAAPRRYCWCPMRSLLDAGQSMLYAQAGIPA